MDFVRILSLILWIKLVVAVQDDMFISFYAYPSPVVLGARVRLICSTAATTLPDFIRLDRGMEALLYVRGNELKVEYTNGQVAGWVEFEIEEARLEDSGNYTCEARWYTDMRKAEYKLEVFGVELHSPKGYYQPGDNVTLTCNTTSYPAPSNMVLRRSAQILVDRSRDNLDIFRSDSMKISYGLQYLIQTVNTEDIGDYMCEGIWVNPNVRHQSTYKLEVPIVSMETEPVYVMYGSQVILTCSATSYTTPSQMGIERYGRTVAIENGRAIDITTAANGQRTGSIRYTIQNVTLNEDGDYYCIGLWFDPYAYINSKYTLKVHTPVTIESMHPKCNTLHPFYTLQDFSIEFTVSGTNVGEAWYYWYPANGQPVVTPSNGTDNIIRSVINGHYLYDQTQATLIRFKLEGDEHLSCHNVTYFNGKYQFVVKDGNGYDAVQETVDIDVYYPALWKGDSNTRSVRVGDYDVILTCDVCSKPRPSISWTLSGEDLPDDVIISQSGSSIAIPEVHEEHFGVYHCTAVNVIEDKTYSRVFGLELKRNSTIEAHQAVGPIGPTTQYILIAVGVAFFIIAVALIVCLLLRYIKRQDSEGTQKVNAELTWKPAPNIPKSDVYTNVNMADPHAPETPVGVYANVGQRKGDHCSNLYADPEKLHRKSTVKIVQDGVTYSDIQILPAPNNKGNNPSPYIHGAEDKVDYACIDWDRTA